MTHKRSNDTSSPYIRISTPSHSNSTKFTNSINSVNSISNSISDSISTVVTNSPTLSYNVPKEFIHQLTYLITLFLYKNKKLTLNNIHHLIRNAVENVLSTILVQLLKIDSIIEKK